jgi:hypothetical protein
LQLTFLTLFLGLISGSQSVALTAGPEVESIEILVDGGPVARVADPPWEAVVDFGPGLLPHHLVARGLDARGREVAAAEQWLNLPRPPAEVEVVLERAAEGPPRAVRLTWQSVTNERPAAISLTLDGKPLALDGDGRAMLPPPPAPPRSAARAGRLKPPPRNPVSAAHVLSAELNFAGGIVARKDLALGDDYGDEVSTDLTAFAVRLRKGGELPPAARLQGWFSAAGKPLRVSAVEAGPAHLLVVRDSGAASRMQGLGWFMSLRHSGSRFGAAPVSASSRRWQPRSPVLASPSSSSRDRRNSTPERTASPGCSPMRCMRGRRRPASAWPTPSRWRGCKQTPDPGRAPSCSSWPAVPRPTRAATMDPPSAATSPPSMFRSWSGIWERPTTRRSRSGGR